MDKLLKKLGKRPSDAGTGPPQRLERFGLFLLAESAPSPDDKSFPVDIIAVHGLNGDAYTTWQHQNGTLWLRDLLPGSLPGCRVFTYGYDAQVAFSTSFAAVQSYARQLLSSVRDIQKESDQIPRPVIFICHSLGGIVCKQVLVFAHENDAVYGRLLKSVVGIVFLGTPHRGSNVANFASLVGGIVNGVLATASAGMGPRLRTDLLDYLKNDSKALQDLNSSVQNRLKGLMIISFYESKMEASLLAVVDSVSAVLTIPGEETILLVSPGYRIRWPRGYPQGVVVQGADAVLFYILFSILEKGEDPQMEEI